MLAHRDEKWGPSHCQSSRRTDGTQESTRKDNQEQALQAKFKSAHCLWVRRRVLCSRLAITKITGLGRNLSGHLVQLLP